MTPGSALLDTDILSAIMRRETAAVAQARNYLSVHAQLTISIITRYEILRGLKAKDATAQLANFKILCAATALEHGRSLVTNKQNHHNRITDSSIKNWLIP